ncbi:MAG: hypothetical protein ISR90_06890 [Candidatus Marinimicrobia bacterium]|nr:hypothetical protein [Candidatus Neomarinimicrobiota bacterium]MBL7023757.1 hypothetical protein [Candidatus Neomarinimicrobiota bacterium]MBL7110020.1 hypothetical protein [Candidatus Neomarinimicrobiota bacterium]
MKKIYFIPLLFSLILIPNCDDPLEENDATVTDTRNLTSIGNGNIGSVDEYFYDFDNEINVTFLNWGYTNLQNPDLNPPNIDDDALSFRTFPSITVTDTSYNPLNDSTFSGYIEITYDELTEADKDSLFTRTVLDSIADYTVLIEDSLEVDQFKNKNFITWDLSLKRYDTNKDEDWTRPKELFEFVDSLDIIEYHVVVDTNVTEIHDVTLFVDTDQLVKAETEYLTLNDSGEPVPHTYGDYISYTKKEFAPDSLQYITHGDCRYNGVIDDAETEIEEECIYGIWNGTGTYCDEPNGLHDMAETFVDENNNSTWDEGELYKDWNCNNQWDDAETEIEAECTDGIWNEEEGFCDVPNGKWDDAETSYNGHIGELSDRPGNLLVDYSNPLNPTIVDSIACGDSLKLKFSNDYYKIIVENEYSDYVQMNIDDIDYIETIWTNNIIDQTFANGSTDYYVTKTEWYDESNDRQYDYHLFKQGSSVVSKLEHPSYFLPGGAFAGFGHDSWEEGTYSPDAFVDGFWFEEFAQDIPLYYTYSGQFRDGEIVQSDTTIVTPIAIYNITKSYMVESDTVTVPLSVHDESDSLLSSNTFFDKESCFKITRELSMIMVGSGVEYGEKNITWVAEGNGIVRDEVYIRWTEPSWINGQQWFPYSKWEIVSYSENEILGRGFNNSNYIKLNELENLPEVNNDPYQKRRTVGLQRVSLIESTGN